MNGRIETATDVLIVVDVQNDFVSGSLAIPGARDIVPVINRLVAGFAHVIVTQDWHPRGHISFASTHAGAKHLGVLD
jgi:nicotinamidase/pyrazinamidase